VTAVVVNPLVRLYDAPVETLTALAYLLALAAVTVALAGLLYRGALDVWLMVEYRHVGDRFGPQWHYVPPLRAFGLVAALLFVAAVEAALLAAIVYVPL
jgi:hypothetical protein